MPHTSDDVFDGVMWAKRSAMWVLAVHYVQCDVHLAHYNSSMAMSQKKQNQWIEMHFTIDRFESHVWGAWNSRGRSRSLLWLILARACAWADSLIVHCHSSSFARTAVYTMMMKLMVTHRMLLVARWRLWGCCTILKIRKGRIERCGCMILKWIVRTRASFCVWIVCWWVMSAVLSRLCGFCRIILECVVLCCIVIECRRQNLTAAKSM